MIGRRRTAAVQVGPGGVLVQGDNYGSIRTNVLPELTWPRRMGPTVRGAEHFQTRRALPEVPPGGGTVVLTGLGGVGKTQIAARYAAQRWAAKDVDLLLWITAGSREQIIDGYAGAAAELGLLLDQVSPDPDPRIAADRLLNWLETADRRWLVVLDDVAAPADLRELWPPDVDGAVTVVTTRRRADALNGPGRTLIEVDLFTSAEACAFLAAKLSVPPEDPDLLGVAEDLGRLPLALAQAASYIADRGLTCAAYRSRFSDRRRPLLRLVPDDDERPDGYAATLAAAWELSIEAADALDPAGLALPLLRLASLFDPNGIPVALFGTEQARTGLVAGARFAADDVMDGLRNLHRLSLVTMADDVVHVHALVQRATREAARRDLPAVAWTALMHGAAEAVVAFAGGTKREPRHLRSVRDQGMVLMRHDDGELWTPDGHRMLYGLGEIIGDLGQFAAAAEHYRVLARSAADHLGPDHADALLARSRRAGWLAEAGHPDQAAVELERVIADRTRALGRDGDENLDDLANLSTYRGEAGDAQAAVRGFETVLARRTRSTGPARAKSLITWHNLARWRGEAGDLHAAVRTYAELIPLFVRYYGADHSATLNARRELAAWRGELDPVAGAAETGRLLSAEIVAEGVGDPRILAIRRDLAVFRGRSGRVSEAIRELAQLIADYEEHVDPDHPDALRARGELAQWQLVAGNATDADVILTDLYADQLRVLGEHHPATIRTRTLLSEVG